MNSTGFIVFVFVIWGFMSCGGGQADSSKEESVEHQINTSEDEISEDEVSLYESPGFSQKYNKYIRYQNVVDRALRRGLRDHYFNIDTVQLKKGVVKRTVDSYSNYSPSDVAFLLKEICSSDPCFGQIDDDASKMHVYAKSLDSLLSLSSFYYNKKDYEDDNGKRGMELHAQIGQAADNYFGVYAKFQKQMAVMADDLTQISLNVLQEKDRMISYYMLASIKTAEKLVDYVFEHSDDYCKTLDFVALDSLFARFDAPVTALESLSLDKERLERELGLKKAFFPQFVRVSSELVVAVKDLKERITTNNWKFPPSHPNVAAKGFVENIGKKYGDLVQSYNTVL